MQRDQNDFDPWWQITSLSTNIEYHVGFDFEYDKNDFIIKANEEELVKLPLIHWLDKVKSLY